MKKLLLGTALSLTLVASASAADLAPAWKAPPPTWSWTGLYVGVQGGAGFGSSEKLALSDVQLFGGGVFPTTFGPGFQSSYGFSGLHGGGTAGFNWQAGPVVFGVEGDFSGANIQGNGDCSNAFGNSLFGPPSACKTNLTAFATATGRLGLAVDHALLYVKGGGAWAHFDHSAVAGAAPSWTASISDNRSGYTVGTGIEYAFLGNWSAKIEYNYLDFGTKNLNMVFNAVGNPSTFIVNLNDRETVHAIKAGLNYRFNWGGPIVTNY
jgi:outer membrane immunogenic protein